MPGAVAFDFGGEEREGSYEADDSVIEVNSSSAGATAAQILTASQKEELAERLGLVRRRILREEREREESVLLWETVSQDFVERVTQARPKRAQDVFRLARLGSEGAHWFGEVAEAFAREVAHFDTSIKIVGHGRTGNSQQEKTDRTRRPLKEVEPV